jgi:hypothetical protein
MLAQAGVKSMLKTVAVSKSQNATVQNKAAFEKAVKELKDLNLVIGRGEAAKIQAVKIVTDLVAKVPVLYRQDLRNRLCEKAGIHRSTFFRWQHDMKENAQLAGVKQLAEKHNRAFTHPFHQACLQAYRDNPDASAIEVFQKACKFTDAQKAKEDPPPIQQFSECLGQYLKKSDDADALMHAITIAPIPRPKLLAALKMALEEIQQ